MDIALPEFAEVLMDLHGTDVFTVEKMKNMLAELVYDSAEENKSVIETETRSAMLAVAIPILPRKYDAWKSTILDNMVGEKKKETDAIRDDLVLTSGVVSTDPNRHAMSRIPDEIGFSLDVRSQSQTVLDAMTDLINEEMADIARERRVEFDLDPVHVTPSALMDAEVVGKLEAAMARIGLEPTTMASGGGHDAAVFANAGVPTAMIFVRNQNGSHNPNEAMEIEDFLAGTSIIYEHLLGANQ